MQHILFAFLLFSCNDISINKVVQPAPELVVYPQEISFGHLISGHESGLKTFAVINAGDEELIIGKPILIEGVSRFDLDENLQENYNILPGEVVEFNVYYEPLTYEDNEAIIRFVTNDEDENDFELLVTGNGDAPLISVLPEEFYFGEISIGCDNEERITIKNEGNLNLLINNVTQMVTQPSDIIMEFGSLPAPPWELLPLQEIDFLVSYIPSDINYDESMIRVESNDPVVPLIEVLQNGDGDVERWFQEVHIQEEIAFLDVIFVVDNSGSMNLFQNQLASQMSAFITIFNASGADYHLSVITTDELRFIPFDHFSWIDITYPDPVWWMENVISQVTVSGSGMEKGIAMAKLALEDEASRGESFWRDEATLVIIYVSDEEDHSTGGWNAYTSFFDNLKATPDLQRHFAVIGDYPSGCQYQSAFGTRTIQFGNGYYNMTNLYNGAWYSICALDWGQQMQNLANTVTTRQLFELEESDPIESTINVTVNGQVVNTWSYDLNLNSVVFDNNSIPESNQTITIEYATWGCGDE
jgi:hypothetical protein